MNPAPQSANPPVGEGSGPVEPSNGLWFAPKEVLLERRADGSILLRSPVELCGCADNIVDYLERWAAAEPDRIFLAQRAPGGGWETLSYAEAWRRVQGVAQALLARGLTEQTPIAILSGASLEHAVLTFAGMLVGIPVSPVSPNYTLLPAARPRLAEIAELLQPALVFAQDAARFAGARDVPRLASATWLSASAGEPGIATLASLYATAPGPAVTAARRAVQPSTVAKILFTSGSTGAPKGVLNTHGMLCSAAQASALVVSSDQVPVGLDWLPWHHTVGGNATLHGILREGGTLYIDDGRPTPGEFRKTIENIREVRPTSLLSVPSAFAPARWRSAGCTHTKSRMSSRSGPAMTRSVSIGWQASTSARRNSPVATHEPLLSLKFSLRRPAKRRPSSGRSGSTNCTRSPTR